MDIIQYLLSVIQYLYQQNCWLISFICRYIPLKQWAFDDSHSPKYQKFKVDELPKVQIIQQEWDWRLLIPYFERRYGVKIKPVSRRKECDIPEDCSCPSCGAPQPYLYRNNGKAGQLKCKVCNTNFSPDENRFAKQFTLRCPHCGKALVAKKERKHFIIHKCVNPNFPSDLILRNVRQRTIAGAKFSIYAAKLKIQRKIVLVFWKQMWYGIYEKHDLSSLSESKAASAVSYILIHSGNLNALMIPKKQQRDSCMTE